MTSCMRRVVRPGQNRRQFRQPWIGLLCVLPLLMVAGVSVGAEAPRALGPGTLPSDVRLGPLRDLDGYFPFAPAASVDAWQTRAAQLRQQMFVALGLWPLPSRTPLNPVIHGRVEQEGYTIEKVYFESMPGFFVTGSLYRPRDKQGKCPAVLCPHGHWANGRFYDCGRDEVRKQIVQGAERFEDAGRSPLQSRCVQLARMGCVVFHWDMIGNADSQQLSQELIHGFAKQRPEMNRPEGWGLFSPQAESHLQSAMGLQAWDSIRALDFVTSLPDVDPGRIAVTGASGGGTQTFILCALDPRVHVAFPAVMVSTAMQGGCTCENACDLRIGTGNIEFAALFAPKPLGMTAADDWTKEMATKGFPELQTHYGLFNAKDQVKLVPLLHFGHNYNYVSRANMYSWLNAHLKLGWTDPIVEEDYHRLTPAELTVWDDQHPRPEGGPDFERRLLAWWTSDAASQIRSLWPRDTDSLSKYQDLVRRGLAAILRPLDTDSPSLGWQACAKQSHSGYDQILGLVTRPLTVRERIGFAPTMDVSHAQEQLPVMLLRPTSYSGRACIVVSPDGKQALLDDRGQPTEPVRRLLNEGICVCGVDLLYQGEFLPAGESLKETRSVPNTREAAAYTFGYNPTVFAERVHDIATVTAFLQQGDFKASQIDVLALPHAGHWAVAARALLGNTISRLAADTDGFRFSHVAAIHDPNFLPGGAKYDDVPGMLAAAAPAPLFLTGEGDQLPEPAAAAYRAAGAAEAAQVHPSPDAAARVNAAIDWLLQK
jgi:dienelactone hydrolase